MKYKFIRGLMLNLFRLEKVEIVVRLLVINLICGMLLTFLFNVYPNPALAVTTDSWLLGPVQAEMNSCDSGEILLQAAFKSPVFSLIGSDNLFLLDTELVSANGNRVEQWSETVRLEAGQSYTQKIKWKCGGLAGGIYTFRQGVFRPGWRENLAWNNQAGSIELKANNSNAVGCNVGGNAGNNSLQSPPTNCQRAVSGQPWWSFFTTYGAFYTDTLSSMQDWRTNGGNAILVEAAWDRLQSYAGAPLDITELSKIKEKINTAYHLGLKVYFSIALQYPPEWVKNSAPKLKNQFGVSWEPESGRGKDMLDWVWSATGRRYIEDFITKTLGSIDLSMITAIRTGGGYYNELHFPPDREGSQNKEQAVSYWGFGNAPLQGQDISPDQQSSPLPGYVPFSGTVEQDTRWSEWYLNSLKNFEIALIKMHRTAGWKGTIFVLHPGYYLRSNFTPSDYSYRIELAEGNDVGRMIDGYSAMPDVWPGTTWLDLPDQGTDLTVDSNLSPWRKLKKEAALRGKSFLLYGENTGGGTNENMNRIFNEPLANGYTVLFWLSYPDLVAGSSGNLENMHNNIKQRSSQKWLQLACWIKLPLLNCPQ